MVEAKVVNLRPPEATRLLRIQAEVLAAEEGPRLPWPGRIGTSVPFPTYEDMLRTVDRRKA